MTRKAQSPSEKLILLVDDSADDVVLLLRDMKALGLRNPHRVLSSGEEAIAYLQGEGQYKNRAGCPQPEILLLDLKMPGRDGFHVLGWIQTQQHLSELLIVVLSGLEDIRSVNRAYRCGAKTFLIKPPRMEDWRELIAAFPDYWLLA